jgi:hypothetical protein
MSLLRRMHEGSSRNALTSLVLSVLVSLGACGDGGSQPGKATVQTESPPDVCLLLTREDVALATGWKNPTGHAVDTGAAFVKSCIFADGDDLAKVATVSVSVGGPTHKSGAEFAQSVGNGGGMLTEPATVVDGFPVPVIATRPIGGMYGMQARTPAAIELTVVTWSIETTRQLFPKALSRLLDTQ